MIHNEYGLNKQGGHNTQAAGSVRGSFLTTVQRAETPV